MYKFSVQTHGRKDCQAMSFQSVDALQRALTENVFHYAKDSKKAAGRALGTLVEIITFYLLKSWGQEKNIAIERRLPEYANPEITHNVEFSLHPSCEIATLNINDIELPLTTKKICKLLSNLSWNADNLKSSQLLSSKKVLRNACTIFEDEHQIIIAYLAKSKTSSFSISVNQLIPHPYAVIECKRVGIEEGNKKGPQTIEKAKQGAYVARTISSLQKIRMSDGSTYGILHRKNEDFQFEPYKDFLRKIVASEDPGLLRKFILSVGIVSNHGNWFTCDNHNKELKILAQSYDWLLFLSDKGLSSFVESLLISPTKENKAIKEAFVQSYSGKKGCNKFTKVQISLEADLALQSYFLKNLSTIESWFNIISPAKSSISELKQELLQLSSKNWKDILS